MLKKFTYTLIALTFIGLLTNCASIVHGTEQKINFASQPTGAKIIIDGIERGTAPKSIILKRKGRAQGEPSDKKGYAVKIELEGYQPHEVSITRQVDGWFIGNLFFGGLIGILIDATNGAMYKLTPDQITAQMATTMAVSEKGDGCIYFGVTLTPDPNWVKIGTMSKTE
jgi:hypothetical protein